MRMFAAAALAASLYPSLALAAPLTSALGAPQLSPGTVTAQEEPGDQVRVAMRLETLAPGGSLPEHRQLGERYLYVVSGQLKVSNLVTGEEQVVGAGKMAAEQPGCWHVAVAQGPQPATFYVIDRGPSEQGVAASASNHGN